MDTTAINVQFGSQQAILKLKSNGRIDDLRQAIVDRFSLLLSAADLSLTKAGSVCPLSIFDSIMSIEPHVVVHVFTPNHYLPAVSNGLILPRDVTVIPDDALDVEVKVELGRSGTATVFSGIWNRSKSERKRVAVKVLNRASAYSHVVARELAASGSRHQNILKLYGVMQGSSLKLVLELMETDLGTFAQQNVFSRHHILRIFRDIAAGVSHLHDNNVMHFNIKPSSLLIRQTPVLQVKLADFGMSRSMKDFLLTHTMNMSFGGTAAYIAPEIAARRSVEMSADVWSLGVLMKEMILKREPSPVTEQDKEELKRSNLCCGDLVDLLLACGSVCPESRPSMNDVLVALEKLILQESNDLGNLHQALSEAGGQDLDTYNEVMQSYAVLPDFKELLQFAARLNEEHRNPILTQGRWEREQQKMTRYSDLVNLADQDDTCKKLMTTVKKMIEESGGTMQLGPRKTEHQAAEKVLNDYGGNYALLFDLERATGNFGYPSSFLRCLQKLRGSDEVEICRGKDRFGKPLANGYRDLLLNIRDPRSGFIIELRLNFTMMLAVKSQLHRMHELSRVMKVALPCCSSSSGEGSVVCSSHILSNASVLHPVSCNSCSIQIRGVRHKCNTCVSFDLCDACFVASSQVKMHTSYDSDSGSSNRNNNNNNNSSSSSSSNSNSNNKNGSAAAEAIHSSSHSFRIVKEYLWTETLIPGGVKIACGDLISAFNANESREVSFCWNNHSYRVLVFPQGRVSSLNKAAVLLTSDTTSSHHVNAVFRVNGEMHVQAGSVSVSEALGMQSVVLPSPWATISVQILTADSCPLEEGQHAHWDLPWSHIVSHFPLGDHAIRSSFRIQESVYSVELKLGRRDADHITFGQPEVCFGGDRGGCQITLHSVDKAAQTPELVELEGKVPIVTTTTGTNITTYWMKCPQNSLPSARLHFKFPFRKASAAVIAASIDKAGDHIFVWNTVSKQWQHATITAARETEIEAVYQIVNEEEEKKIAVNHTVVLLRKSLNASCAGAKPSQPSWSRGFAAPCAREGTVTLWFEHKSGRVRCAFCHLERSKEYERCLRCSKTRFSYDSSSLCATCSGYKCEIFCLTSEQSTTIDGVTITGGMIMYRSPTIFVEGYDRLSGVLSHVVTSLPRRIPQVVTTGRTVAVWCVQEQKWINAIIETVERTKITVRYGADCLPHYPRIVDLKHLNHCAVPLDSPVVPWRMVSIQDMNPTSSELTCRNNHGLRSLITAADQIRCDICGAVQLEGATTMSCRSCDFDACVDCVKKTRERDELAHRRLPCPKCCMFTKWRLFSQDGRQCLSCHIAGTNKETECPQCKARGFLYPFVCPTCCKLPGVVYIVRGTPRVFSGTRTALHFSLTVFPPTEGDGYVLLQGETVCVFGVGAVTGDTGGVAYGIAGK